jgi:glycine/D-amino acid oxidase-like deaminating enzyme
MGISTSDSIIIVGAGAFALSTALHLSQQGYTNVSVFAKEDHIPSGNLTAVVYPKSSVLLTDNTKRVEYYC